MYTTLAVPALALAFAVPAIAQQDARSIIETSIQKQAERTSTVENYTVVLSFRDAMSAQTPVYYEQMAPGLFRRVPPGEYGEQAAAAAGIPPVDRKAFFENAAMGYEMMGPAMSQDPASQMLNVRGMTDSLAMFSRAMAQMPEESDGRAEAQAGMLQLEEFAEIARLVGVVQVVATNDRAPPPPATRDAYLLMAEDLQRELPSDDGARFMLEKVSMWIDTEHYVPLRLKMEGQVEQDGEITPLTIEKFDLDYRQVGPMFEPYQHRYRIGGLMAGFSDKEKKDLQKAVQELEKAKAELAKLPQSQQDQVMKMIGPKMKQIEEMAAGGDIVSVVDVVSIAINEGPPTPFGPGSILVTGPAGDNYPRAVTMAGEDPDAELAILAIADGETMVKVSLIGNSVYPDSVAASVQVTDASGVVKQGSGETRIVVTIDSGTGEIVVTQRSETRIKGTFSAALTGTRVTDDGPETVQFSVSGTFDSGAPTSATRAPRGSPLDPASFTQP